MTTGTTAATSTPSDDDVRWLSATEQRHWRAYRDGTARLLDVLAHDLEAQTGLGIHEYELLVRLSESPGRTLRMSELAAGLAHSRSRLTHTVRRMEDAGMVERRACASDARGVECVMTEAGWQRLVAAAPRHVASVRAHLVDRLTAEQFAALGDAMRVVGEALETGCRAHAAAQESGQDAGQDAGQDRAPRR